MTHLRCFSGEALAEVEGPVDVLYIDGAHRYRPALADIRRWGARVADGGTMLIHDSFSSIGVTLAIATTVATSGEFTYLGRTGSLAAYVRAPAGGVGASARRHASELPWFAKNLVLKARIAGKLLKLDLAEVMIASNACILGPAPAAALAASKGWQPLIAPGILVGMFGYAIATFIGVTMAALLAW